jgi:hypothetical protein
MRRPGRHRPDQLVAMRRNPWSPSPECAGSHHEQVLGYLQQAKAKLIRLLIELNVGFATTADKP